MTFFNPAYTRVDLSLIVFVVCPLSILLICLADYLTGYEISFFIFYAIPIAFATWYGNRRMGLLYVALSTVMWFSVDHYSGHPYSRPFIPYWNGMIRFCFFMFVAWTLDNIRTHLRREEMNADFDSLTNLLNGRGLRERAASLLPLMKRLKQSYALAFIDLDNFKTVNDTMGHAEGDAILQKVAAIMKSSLRASDMVARLGGDEFVIFLPDTGMEQSRIVLEGLKTKLDAAVRSENWPIGFSIGLGVFGSADTSVEEALSFADALMYEVKRAGKGTVVYREK